MVRDNNTEAAGKKLTQIIKELGFKPDTISIRVRKIRSKAIPESEIKRIISGDINFKSDVQLIFRIAEAIAETNDEKDEIAFDLLKKAGFISGLEGSSTVH